MSVGAKEHAPGAHAVGRVRALGRQAVDLRPAEDIAEVEHRQGVDLVVARQGQDAPQPAQVQLVAGLLGQRVAVVGFQTGQPAFGDVVVVGVDEHGAHVLVGQGAGQGAGEGMRADDERALRLALGQPQPASDRPGRQSIEDDRADDDQKDDRRQQFRLGHTRRGQFEGEDRRHRRGDDAPRSHPHQEEALGVAQRRAPGGQQHAQRPGHQNEQGDETQGGPADGQQVGHVYAAGQQDEQNANQQDLQVLFELDDVADGNPGLVGQGDAHEGDGQQAALGRQQVAQREEADDEHQRDAALQVVGDEVAAHEGHQHRRAEQAQDDADDQAAADAQQHEARHVDAAAEGDDLDDEQGQHRADGVDEDAFPLQDGPAAPFGPNLAQQRADDGGAGDDQDCAEDDGQRPVEAEQEARPQRGHEPGRQRADGDEPRHDRAAVGQFLELQRQAALKEDQADGQRHEREKRFPQQPVGVNQAEDRAEQETRQQQQQDGRQAQMPGDQLRPHADDGNERQLDKRFFHKDVPSLQPAREGL